MPSYFAEYTQNLKKKKLIKTDIFSPASKRNKHGRLFNFPDTTILLHIP